MNRKWLFILLFFGYVMGINAMDFWRYPELAESGSIFVGVYPATFHFRDLDPQEPSFSFVSPEFAIDYILPIGLPFSMGMSIRPLVEEQFAFGLRPGYHINFNMPSLDAYILYNIMANITSYAVYMEYGGRFGFRFKFGRNPLILSAESGFSFNYLNFGLALKLN